MRSEKQEEYKRETLKTFLNFIRYLFLRSIVILPHGFTYNVRAIMHTHLNQTVLCLVFELYIHIQK